MRFAKYAGFLAALLVILSPASRAAAAEDVAVMSQVEGAVWVRLNDETEWGASEEGMLLQQDDAIKTGADGRARVVLEDGSAIMVGPLSIFRIGEVKMDYAAGGKNMAFSLDEGRARATVTKLGASGSSFEVTTPTAVAGVRGTDFAVEALPREDRSTITVFEGEVEVGSRAAGISERVRVLRDHSADVVSGRAPEKPRKIDAEKLQRMKQELSRRARDRGEGEAAGLDDDGRAAAFVAAYRSKLPEGERAEIAAKIKSGELPARQTRQVLALTHRDVPRDQVKKVMEIVGQRRMQDGDVDKLVEKIAGMKNKDDIRDEVDKFTRDGQSREQRQKPVAEPGGPERKTDQRPPDNVQDVVDKFKRGEMDRDKLKDMIDKMDPNDPRRKELALIQRALDKGIPREKLELILEAMRKRRIDPAELGMIINAAIRGADLDFIKDALEKLYRLKVDPQGRRMLLRALELGIDRDRLQRLLDQLEADSIDIRELKERIQKLIEERLPDNTDVRKDGGGGAGDIGGNVQPEK